MLVLSRKVNEGIMIDGRTLVRIVSVRGDQVRLGIEATKDVVVDRLEVHERKQQQAADLEKKAA